MELSPHPAVVFEGLSTRLYGGLELATLADHAPIAAPTPYVAPEPAKTVSAEGDPGRPATGTGPFLGSLKLQRYKPLFSGPFVERVPELQFQRPDAEVVLSSADAEKRGIVTGDAVSLRSNGTSVELRARVERRLVEGVVRVADEHAGELHPAVEVVKA